MSEPVPMRMCPMAETCKQMMRKPFSGLVLVIPGLLMFTVGVAIILEPGITVWLVAAGAILMGVMMLAMAAFMHRIGRQMMRD